MLVTKMDNSISVQYIISHQTDFPSFWHWKKLISASFWSNDWTTNIMRRCQWKIENHCRFTIFQHIEEMHMMCSHNYFIDTSKNFTYTNPLYTIKYMNAQIWLSHLFEFFIDSSFSWFSLSLYIMTIPWNLQQI